MRRRALLGLTASCVLGACAHPVATPGGGMAWSLNHTPEEGAKLAFGRPQSDDILVMLTCQSRSGQVRVSLSAPADGPIEIASGDTRSRLAGASGPGMNDGAVLIEAAASAKDATLRRFARTGRLAVGVGSARAELPADREARTRIAAFFSSCRAA